MTNWTMVTVINSKNLTIFITEAALIIHINNNYL